MKLWKNWKTRIFGLLQVAFGGVTANSEYLRNAIDPKWFGVIMFCTGIATVILGFLNSRDPAPPPAGG